MNLGHSLQIKLITHSLFLLLGHSLIVVLYNLIDQLILKSLLLVLLLQLDCLYKLLVLLWTKVWLVEGSLMISLLVFHLLLVLNLHLKEDVMLQVVDSFKVLLYREVIMFSLDRSLMLFLFLLLSDSELCYLFLKSSLSFWLCHLVVFVIFITLLFVMIIDYWVALSRSKKSWVTFLIVVITHSFSIVKEVAPTHIERLNNWIVL